MLRVVLLGDGVYDTEEPTMFKMAVGALLSSCRARLQPGTHRGEGTGSPLLQICSVCFEKYVCGFSITSHCEWLIC